MTRCNLFLQMISLAVFVSSLFGCAGKQDTPTPDRVATGVAGTRAAAATLTADALMLAPTLSHTPQATHTPRPTSTPWPTRTPRPMPTLVGKLSLQGTVTRGIYSPPVGSLDQFLYHVRLRIENTRAAPFSFDMAEGIFVTREGKGIGTESYPGAVLQGEPAMILGLEEGVEFEYDTNGYTLDLLEEAGDGPLFFCFTLFLDEEAVEGPFCALLPDLERLLAHEESLEFSLLGE